jgi:hypothetical protein
MVHDESKPRGYWKLARIKELIIYRKGWSNSKSSPQGSIGQWMRDCLTASLATPLSTSLTPDEDKEINGGGGVKLN